MAKSFSINDVEISTPFEINFNKNNIIDEGFKKAFDRLILSIAQSSEQKKIKNTSLSLIKGMIETFSIKEEKFIDEIYYLTLNVSFNKKKVFDLLEVKNIFPSLPIKKDVLFIPIIIEANKNLTLMFSENYLFNNWNSNIKKYHLLNFILPTEDLEDYNLIKNNSENLETFNFEKIIKKYNLEDYIIAIVFKNNDEIKVLNKINFNNKLNLKNLKFENLSLKNEKEYEKLIENLKVTYENYWKSKNEINNSIKLILTLSINNDDNSQISKFEETLSNIDLIYDFFIFKFNNKNNIYKIIFNGLPDNFLNIMKDNNYNFDTQNQIWILK
tara:strand:- start:584 stop:1567 length:984 start_codon:yes stop_codon:yes gene_type:complete